MKLEIFDDIEQGSPQWWACRIGIPTCSMFEAIMAKGKDKKPDGSTSKTRRKYMMRLAAERITGEPVETYSNHHMERGKEQEPEARSHYALKHLDADIKPIGFIRREFRKGFLAGGSPDSLIDDNGCLEIKTRLPDLQAELLLGPKELPAENRHQVQGQLWISGREFCDYVSYCQRMPMFEVRAYRDEPYIDLIEREVRAFSEELAEVEKRIRALDGGSTLMADLRESATILGAS